MVGLEHDDSIQCGRAKGGRAKGRKTGSRSAAGGGDMPPVPNTTFAAQRVRQQREQFAADMRRVERANRQRQGRAFAAASRLAPLS